VEALKSPQWPARRLETTRGPGRQEMARNLRWNGVEVGVIALKNILVATDFNEPSAAAVRYGKELARRFDASLHVLHVADDLSTYPSPAWGVPLDLGYIQTTLEEEARANLDKLVPEPERSALRARLVVTVAASPAPAILTYARDESIDLIIVGTHGRQGLSHFFMGSVAQHLCRAATCPVLTVRAHERDFIQPDAPPQLGEVPIPQLPSL
jgi:universal stress protein A